jgi:hypothetical protein
MLIIARSVFVLLTGWQIVLRSTGEEFEFFNKLHCVLVLSDSFRTVVGILQISGYKVKISSFCVCLRICILAHNM